MGNTERFLFVQKVEMFLLYLLCHWTIGDVDLLRQSHAESGFPAGSGRELACSYPPRDLTPQTLPCRRCSRKIAWDTRPETKILFLLVVVAQNTYLLHGMQ